LVGELAPSAAPTTKIAMLPFQPRLLHRIGWQYAELSKFLDSPSSSHDLIVRSP
jgi:hypothetical protein